jgi:hypothetical protein
MKHHKECECPICAKSTPSTWNPASTPPPAEVFDVIVKGGNYAITEAYYSHNTILMKSGQKKPPGFYLLLGGGHMLDAPWVEWWIPTPAMP